MPALRITTVDEFGRAAEEFRSASIDVGGFLVLGEESAFFATPADRGGVYEYAVSEGSRKEAGSTAGSWQGRRASRPETAAHSATQALGTLKASWHGNGITATEFEELDAYFPDLRVTTGSSRSVFLTVTAGLFRDLEYRAQLVMEVPRPEHAPVPWRRDGARAVATWAEPSVILGNRGPELQFPPIGLVPPVRTWARWLGGVCSGMTIIGNHRYPDHSICVCMDNEWRRGFDYLVDYTALSVSWVGKVIHEQLVGFYPGPQHLREWVRVERDRVAEFCGCGSTRRYGECCRREDRRLNADQFEKMRRETWTQYFQELSLQGRPFRPPPEAWCLT